MKKRVIAVIGIGVLSIGLMTGGGFSLTDTNLITGQEVSREKVEYNLNRKDKKQAYQEMLRLMRKNGFKELSKAHITNDYDQIDDFMNSMTDEEYEKMIEIMEDSEYGYMADMMRRIDKEEMIDMHNSMGGAENCHGSLEGTTNTGMMGNY